MIYWFVHKIYRLVSRLDYWLYGFILKAKEREMLTLFPPDCRVQITSGCPCGEKFVGQEGRVEGLTSMGAEERDYRVWVDGRTFGDGTPTYDMICGRAMERI